MNEGTFITAAKSIGPILDEHRAWADQNARMAPSVKEAAARAGMFTLFAPRETGGGEVTLPEALAVLEELAYADPAVAWHAGNSTGVSAAAAAMSDEYRATVLGSSRGPFGLSVVTGGVARPEPGGYRLTGSWPFLTGALDADWALLFASVEQAPAQAASTRPEVRRFIVPAGDFKVDRTWDLASAMRGTRSHAVHVRDAFVPDGLSLAFSAVSFDRPLYRLDGPVGALLSATAIALGTVRRIFDECLPLVAGKVSRMDGLAYSDRPEMQRAVGGAAARIEALRASMAAAVAEMWRHAEAGRVPPTVRGRFWATAFWVMDECRAAASELFVLSTSAVYGGRNPIETGLRDLHAICAAMESLRYLATDFGRVLLGLSPAHPNF